MQSLFKILLVVSLITLTVSCSSVPEKELPERTFPEVVYQSDNLIITRLTNKVYEHTSFLETNDFGKVPCNGMMVNDEGEVIIFDTPADEKSTKELIRWIQSDLKGEINAVIPTHFHADCLGGLNEFKRNKIPSYAVARTIALAEEKALPVPDHSFDSTITLYAGNQKIIATFFGEGHTKDNIVGYVPGEQVLFGGCLIKELAAGKGNLEDADTSAWSGSVRKIKAAYPDVKIVIPGHGNVGDRSLLDYTIKLFETKEKK